LAPSSLATAVDHRKTARSKPAKLQATLMLLRCSINYYQLRELGYFKTDRKSAKNNQVKNSQLVFGLIPIGSTGMFVTMNDDRISVPNPEVLTETNIASFTPYLHEPRMGKK
jgi:hypothetical protein